MPTKYTPIVPPNTNLRAFIYEELKKLAIVIDQISTPVARFSDHLEIGEPNSAGPGYRTIKFPSRIPN